MEIENLKKVADERETYIKGLEKTNRQLEQEAKLAAQQDRDTLTKIKDLEKDLALLSEQNESLIRNLKDKELTISHLEKTIVEQKRDNQQILQDLTSRLASNQDNSAQGSRYKARNRSVDMQENLPLFNRQSAPLLGHPHDNYKIPVDEVLQIVGCSNLAELI